MMAVAVACAPEQAESQERRLLPGYADLPVVAGDPKCGPSTLADEDATALRASDCVLTTVSTINEIFKEYAGLITRSGWRFTGGAAVVFNFQRDRDDGGCEGLDLAALTDFAALEREGITEEEAAAQPGSVFFFRKDDVPCYPELTE